MFPLGLPLFRFLSAAHVGAVRGRELLSIRSTCPISIYVPLLRHTWSMIVYILALLLTSSFDTRVRQQIFKSLLRRLCWKLLSLASSPFHPLRFHGEVFSEKLSGSVRPASQNPYPIYDQSLRYSLPLPDKKFETLF